MTNDFISVGKLTKTHALKGALKMRSFSIKSNFFEYTDRVFVKKENQFIELHIDKVSVAKDHLILKFTNIKNIDDAQTYKGLEVFISRDDIPINPGEILLEDIIGFDVYYNEKQIGKVDSFTDFGAGLLYVVITNDKKEIFLPDNDEFIELFDAENKRVVFKDIEDLL